MDTHQLRAYVAVATHRSFSAAAQELGLSQSALSRLVQRLEVELGVRLIDRGRRPLNLTPAGEEVLRYARQILDQWQALLGRLQADVREVTGPLRIAASTTPGEFLVPGLLADFTRQYPKVEPIVDIMDTRAVVNYLLTRRYDVGFIGAPITGSILTLIEVARDEVRLAVPAHHPFAQRESIRLEELAGQSIILREKGSGTYYSVLRCLRKRGLSLPPHRVVMVLGSAHAILSAVRAGLGIGFVSSLALATVPAGEVKGVTIEGLDLHRALYLAYEEARLVLPVVRTFVAFIRSWAGTQCFQKST